MGQLIFKGCTFEDNVIGISATKETNIDAENTKFIRNNKGVEVRGDIPNEIIDLFKPGVHLGKIKSIIDYINETNESNPTPIARRLKKSGLSSWIANGANTVTVATAIIEAIKFLGS